MQFAAIMPIKTFITCHLDKHGNLWPMGHSKTKEEVEELAKLHKHVICHIIPVKDFREKDSNNLSVEK